MLHLDQKFSKVKLGHFPTPIEHLSRLSNELGVDIYAKRDDICSGLAYGGNKTRKLQYLAADAIAQGCDTLVSIGGIQSNHTRQVTAVAAKLGLEVYTVQETWAEWHDPIYDRVGNILLSRIMGGHTVQTGYGYSASKKQTWHDLIEKLKSEGRKPYPIPAGASDHPLGGLGYADFADEVVKQEEEMSTFFDVVVTATCTGSTQAGMVVGFANQDRRRRVIGIDTADDKQMTHKAVTKIAKQTIQTISERGIDVKPWDDADLEINGEYSHPAYGIPSEKTIECIKRVASLEGMLTDPVYEGKSVAGLIGMCEKGEIPSGAKVLYVHLGGVPAVHAYYQAFENTENIEKLGREARA